MPHGPAGWGRLQVRPQHSQPGHPSHRAGSPLPGRVGSTAPRPRATPAPGGRALSPRLSAWAAGLVLFGALQGSPAPHRPALGDQRAGEADFSAHEDPALGPGTQPRRDTNLKGQGAGPRKGRRRAALSTSGRAAQPGSPQPAEGAGGGTAGWCGTWLTVPEAPWCSLAAWTGWEEGRSSPGDSGPRGRAPPPDPKCWSLR